MRKRRAATASYLVPATSLGLLITEGTYVDESSGPSGPVPRFFGAAPLAGWRDVAEAVLGRRARRRARDRGAARGHRGIVSRRR